VYAGPAWVDCGGRIVTNEDGSAVRPDRLSLLFTRSVRAAGLPPIGVHGLWHSNATAARRAGVSAEVLSKRLGHADVAITLSTYAHVLESDDQAEAASVPAAMLGPR
jgi:integrase